MNRYLFVLVVLFCIVGLRIGVFYLFPTSFSDSQVVTLSYTFLSEPTNKGSVQEFFVNLPQKNWWQGTKQALVIASAYPQYSYGDTIVLSGKPQNKVLAGSQTITTISFPQIAPYKTNNPLLMLLADFRQAVLRLFTSVLPTEAAGLLMGIVFGIKSGIGQSFTTQLKATGVIHVVAASGMNITMVASFLMSIFGVFLKRQVAIVAAIAGIAVYAVLSGLESSIIRAAIMGSIVFSAQLFGRQYLPLYGLALTGVVMLFINPLLGTDVGFQLSFLSTAGIVLFKSSFDILFKKLPVLKEDLATTISAQIATTPILLSTFGTYALFSVLVNLLVLWTIPFLMIIGGVGAIVGLLIPFIGKLIIWLGLPILTYFIQVVGYFGSQNNVVRINELPVIAIFGYYLLLIGILLYLKQRKKTSLD